MHLLLRSSFVLLLLSPAITSYSLINWFSLDDLFGMKDWTYQSRDLSKEPLVRGLQYRRTYPYSLESTETKSTTTTSTTTTIMAPTTTSTTTTSTTTTEAPFTAITTTTSNMQAPTTLDSTPELTMTTSTTMAPVSIVSSAVITAIISDALGSNSDSLLPLAASPQAEAPKTETKRDNGESTPACPDNNDPKRIFNRGVDFPTQSGWALTDPSLQSFTCPPNTLFSSYSLCAPGICCSNIPVGITGTLILLTLIVLVLSILVIRPFFTCTRNNKNSEDLLPVAYNDWKGAKFSREVCEVEPLSLKGDSLAFPFSFSSSVHRKVLPLEEEPPAYAAHPKYIQKQPKILVFHI